MNFKYSEKWKIVKNLVLRKKKKKTNQISPKNMNSKLLREILNEESGNNFLNDYRHNLKFSILRSSRDEVVLESFELSLPHANSLRRILLGEINIYAIDKVFFYCNSSVLNDEDIAHRLGLVPISVNSEFLSKVKIGNKNNLENIILELKVKNSQKSFKKISVYSKSLKIKRYGLFFSVYKNLPVNPVFRDILILKLNPGQKIKCECHCVVDSGLSHAKFSPVGTAFYRICPKIKIVKEIMNESADHLYEVCPVKVFGVDKIWSKEKKRLMVLHPEFCTLCKECLRIENTNPYSIRISRIKNKINFIIESTGVLSPEALFHRAITLLVGKCNSSLSILFKSFSIA